MSARAPESTHPYRWVILGLSILSQWSLALSVLAIAPLAPLFQPELGLSKAEVGLFSSAVFAGSWVVLLVAGAITDRFGVRTVLFLAQSFTGLVLLSMSMAGSFVHALLVMGIAGLGRGSGVPCSTKAIMDWFPPSTRATAMGLKQAGIPVAGILTAALLPALGLAVGWRFAIVAVGVCILGAGIITWVLYREGPRQGQARESRTSLRAGVGELLRSRKVWTVSLLGVLFSTIQLSLIAHLALYMKEIALVPVMPDEPSRIVAAGGYLALYQAGGVLGRILWGFVSDRILHGLRMAVAAIIGALSGSMCMALGWPGLDLPLWLLTGVLFTLGMSAVGWNGLYHVLMAEAAGRKYSGTGVGLIMSLAQVGTVGGPPLFGFIVDGTGSYRVAWLFLGCLGAIGALVSIVNARGEKEMVE